MTSTEIQHGGKEKKIPFDRKFLEAIDSPIDYSKMEAVKETRYSSDLPHQVYQLVKTIRLIDPKLADEDREVKILDGTAHVGSFTLCWAALFPKHRLTSVEINPETFKRLKRNVEKFEFEDRIEVVNDNTAEYIEKIKKNEKFDFVYLDPPWGGPDYRFKKGMMLYLGKKTVVDVISEIFKRALTDWVFFKAPLNFDVQSLPFKFAIFSVMGTKPEKAFPDYMIICIGRINSPLGL